MLAGYYNAQKVGLSLDYLESALWDITVQTAEENYSRNLNLQKYIDELNDEKVDQLAYRAGYELASSTTTWNLTQQDFNRALFDFMEVVNGKR